MMSRANAAKERKKSFRKTFSFAVRTNVKRKKRQKTKQKYNSKIPDPKIKDFSLTKQKTRTGIDMIDRKTN